MGEEDDEVYGVAIPNTSSEAEPTAIEIVPTLETSRREDETNNSHRYLVDSDNSNAELESGSEELSEDDEDSENFESCYFEPHSDEKKAAVGELTPTPQLAAKISIADGENVLVHPPADIAELPVVHLIDEVNETVFWSKAFAFFMRLLLMLIVVFSYDGTNMSVPFGVAVFLNLIVLGLKPDTFENWYFSFWDQLELMIE